MVIGRLVDKAFPADSGANRAGPIDALEVRIPRGANLTMRVRDILDDLLQYPSRGSIRATRLYKHSVDLSSYGLKSNLYYRNRQDGNHKLQLRGTGAMTLSEILCAIGDVSESDPRHLAIMRIDLAVDVPAYPVEWFRQNTRIARKRNTLEYDRLVSERKRVETLYFGKRPNIFRIYDKTEEQRVEYQRMNSKRNACEPLLTFEEQYGHSENEILTRVERQYGGGRVPKQITNLERLQENAISLNPFDPLRFLPITISEQSVDELDGDAFIKGQGILRLIETRGYHEAKRLIDHKTCRNADRLLAQLTRSTSSDRTGAQPDLCGIFRQAISKQLEMPTRCL
jgi:hypothetical protein